jgi:hypothetical protein
MTSLEELSMVVKKPIETNYLTAFRERLYSVFSSIEGICWECIMA